MEISIPGPDRVFVCEDCGKVQDRDYKAARNLAASVWFCGVVPRVSRERNAYRQLVRLEMLSRGG